VHTIGIAGLILIFVVGTLRPVNLGALALVMTFLVGMFAVHESPRELYSGFPVDLLILLVGVTYLFAVAVKNGTVEHIVHASVRAAQGRRALIPWVVFALAAAPAMAGALGSTGVALLAPLAMRVAERTNIDRRLMGLMVVHGAAAGNFSPLNVLGAIVRQAVVSRGLSFSVWTLFAANLAANLILAAILVRVFSRPRPFTPSAIAASPSVESTERLSTEHIATLAVLAAVAIVSLGFGLSIGFIALAGACLLQLAFPRSSEGAERLVAWGVVLLVCGVVTYIGALQRWGTIAAVGEGIASLGSPLMVAFLLCLVGAVTSAFASSAGILGAMIPLAAPLMSQGAIGTTGLVTALSLSATLVDAAPFSTVGALVVANASEGERRHVYRGLLAWGAVMVVLSPIVTWLVFVLPA
jgi:Na+/H+ antiporter NhaD/arsenite permease-like protein